MKPRGFTLLEMLVVLALIGVMAGIALPNFSRFLDSFSVRNQWAGVERELADIPYQVFVSGSSFRFDSSSAGKRLTSLPEGWRVEVASHILYRYSGWCEGGRLAVVSAGGERRNYQLAAPACSPTVISG
jgi:prepilin-type N-terminal cleavage/methylation domain-containing protein